MSYEYYFPPQTLAALLAMPDHARIALARKLLEGTGAVVLRENHPASEGDP